jgi:hypothetical protein
LTASLALGLHHISKASTAEESYYGLFMVTIGLTATYDCNIGYESHMLKAKMAERKRCD